METKDILKDLRRQKGFKSAQDFCEAVGISYNTYQNYETGKRIPTADILCTLADFYGVTTDYLLGRNEDAGTLLDRMQTDEELPFEARVLAAAYLSLGKADRERLMAMVREQREKLSGDERIEVPTGDLPDPKKDSETSSSA